MSKSPSNENGNSASIAELRGVGKVYGSDPSTRVVALDQIDLTVADGEFVAIVGASGSGKSTLLHILGCLDRPTAGDCAILGHDLRKLPDRRLSELRNRRIGFVFQSFHLLPDEPAIANVMLPLVYAEVARSEARRRAEEALKRVGLADRLSHRPGELSGGEQQRVAVARALVKDPDVLLADEPTGNLDSRNGGTVMHLVEAAHERGIGVVLVTHDSSVAARAERIVRLRDGRVESDGPE